MTLTVQTHKTWLVTANGEIENELLTDEIKTVYLKTTPPLSPYLWTVNAGDFKVSTFDGVVPQRIFYRGLKTNDLNFCHKLLDVGI